MPMMGMSQPGTDASSRDLAEDWHESLGCCITVTWRLQFCIGLAIR